MRIDSALVLAALAVGAIAAPSPLHSAAAGEAGSCDQPYEPWYQDDRVGSAPQPGVGGRIDQTASPRHPTPTVTARPTNSPAAHPIPSS